MSIIKLAATSLALHSQFTLAKECPQGKHWVESHFRKGYLRYDGVRVKPTRVSGHCRENPRGYEQWSRKLSNKRPEIWGYHEEQSKRWSTQEIQRLIDAISVLPDELINIKKLRVHRMNKSRYLQNHATTNVPNITLYDLAFESDKFSLAQVFSHELAHAMYHQLSKELKDSFGSAVGWISLPGKPGFYRASSEKIYILPDSRDSRNEDFANHIELFLFQPDRLKVKSPTGFNWIKSQFSEDFKLKKKEKDEN